MQRDLTDPLAGEMPWQAWAIVFGLWVLSAWLLYRWWNRKR